MTDVTMTSAPPASAVSWGAIFAGAAGAAAISLILILLGTGLGMSSVSPWSGEGVAAATFGIGTVVWITFTQLAASGLGGYLSGRLRTRWHAVHTDEVYFRDTAHGFLAWAIATLVTAALLTSTVTAIVGGGAKAAASVAGGVVSTAATAAAPAAATAVGKSDGGGDTNYFVDSLFRKAATAAAPADGAASGPASGMTGAPVSGGSNGSDTAGSASEVARIIANGLSSGSMSPEDTRYVGQIVAQKAGIPQADAEKRVTDTFAKMQAKAKEVQTAAQDAADKARKASAYGALWLFVSLLVGAFVASLAATYGGRQRDLV